MRIDGPQGQSLALEVVGFEFPLTNTEDDDWLLIHGHVEKDSLSWSFRDPSLTVDELKSLTDWLLRFGQLPVGSSLSFIEPNLELRVICLSPPILRVYFRLEARPPREHAGEDRMADDVWIDLDASPSVLANAARDLREAMDKCLGARSSGR